MPGPPSHAMPLSRRCKGSPVGVASLLSQPVAASRPWSCITASPLRVPKKCRAGRYLPPPVTGAPPPGYTPVWACGDDSSHAIPDVTVPPPPPGPFPTIRSSIQSATSGECAAAGHRRRPWPPPPPPAPAPSKFSLSTRSPSLFVAPRCMPARGYVDSADTGVGMPAAPPSMRGSSGGSSPEEYVGPGATRKAAPADVPGRPKEPAWKLSGPWGDGGRSHGRTGRRVKRRCICGCCWDCCCSSCCWLARAKDGLVGWQMGPAKKRGAPRSAPSRLPPSAPLSAAACRRAAVEEGAALRGGKQGAQSRPRSSEAATSLV
mmetsp:Transcript_4076/g.11661  ORF Transcript_4076/g.11661 Transcript_4076/m.11661 type:complete len:318 (-) Transcript_4076:144-1097(-)